MTSKFSLNPSLAADTVFVAALELCDVLLMNDANYPWLVLVPRLPDAIEVVDLDAATRHRLIDEIAKASEALRSVAGGEKLNVGALGNQVAQLHVHIISNFRDDPAWPKPVWGAVARTPYTQEQRMELTDKLVDHLS